MQGAFRRNCVTTWLCKTNLGNVNKGWITSGPLACSFTLVFIMSWEIFVLYFVTTSWPKQVSYIITTLLGCSFLLGNIWRLESSWGSWPLDPDCSIFQAKVRWLTQTLPWLLWFLLPIFPIPFHLLCASLKDGVFITGLDFCGLTVNGSHSSNLHCSYWDHLLPRKWIAEALPLSTMLITRDNA